MSLLSYKCTNSHNSLQAYARPAFANVQYELYPPLELCGNYSFFQGVNRPTTRENLMKFLTSHVHARENSFYKRGQYTVKDSPRIDYPKGIPNGTTNADLIVTYWYERRCDAQGHDLPPDLTSKEQFAALYFSGKGVVIVQAANFERHDKSIDIMDIVSSVRFIKNAPYYGYERGMNPATFTIENVPRSSSNGIPKICFQCGDTKSDTDVKKCSRCKVAIYCSAECQKADWKRHKNGECLPRDVGESRS